MAENTYSCEYAKTGRARCKYSGCKQVIESGKLRIGKSHPSGFGDGDATDWYHADCVFRYFLKARKDTKKIEATSDISGFKKLEEKDQNTLKKLVQQSVAGEIKPTTAKKAEPKGKGKGKAAAKGKTASKPAGKGPLKGMTFAISGKLSKSRSELKEDIESAGGTVASSVTKAVTHLLCPDPDSGSAQVVAAKSEKKKIVDEDWLEKKIGGGDDSDSGSDSDSESGSDSDSEEKKPAKRGREKKEKSDSDSDEPPKKKKKIQKSSEESDSEEDGGSKPLKGYVIAISGTLSKSRAQITADIEKAGGSVAKTITKAVNVVIVDKSSATTEKVKKAKKDGKTIVKEDWLTAKIAGKEVASESVSDSDD